MTRRSALALAGAVSLLVATLADTALADGDVEVGADLYLLHCATCHGVDATGSGPMSGVLMIPPTDLTTLTALNAGTFPLERVIARIDGRDPLVSHGSPMPVYGFFFEGEDAVTKTDAGQPVMTSQPILDLVAYLRGLQGL
jgi:mono/diheme cytochrome c family protein